MTGPTCSWPRCGALAVAEQGLAPPGEPPDRAEFEPLCTEHVRTVTSVGYFRGLADAVAPGALIVLRPILSAVKEPSHRERGDGLPLGLVVIDTTEQLADAAGAR